MNQRGYYSRKVRAGKRTYFFDVRATRSGDFFMTITESKKRHNDSGFDNHKVFIYKEDFHKFIHAMKEGLEHIHVASMTVALEMHPTLKPYFLTKVLDPQ